MMYFLIMQTGLRCVFLDHVDFILVITPAIMTEKPRAKSQEPRTKDQGVRTKKRHIES